jgi:hypothetical protein
MAIVINCIRKDDPGLVPKSSFMCLTTLLKCLFYGGQFNVQLAFLSQFNLISSIIIKLINL